MWFMYAAGYSRMSVICQDPICAGLQHMGFDLSGNGFSRDRV